MRDDEDDREAGDSHSENDETDETADRSATYFRLLNGADVAALIDIDALIDAMREALRQFSTGGVQQPVRTVLTVGDSNWLGVMPAVLQTPAAIGAKLITVFGSNARQGLPSHLGAVLLFSPHTGALVAMMDGRTLTESRTAAVSALSAQVLARDDVEEMAIIGTGAQARAHLLAMERVFDLKTVRVWSPTPDHPLNFVAEMSPHTEADLVASASPERAVHGMPLIVLATSATEPVVQNEWIRSGAHIVSIGACRPDQRELDPALIRRSRLFVDSRAAAQVESGDIILGLAQGAFSSSHIVGELGEAIAGTVDGRRTPTDITIFKSLGLAVEDVAAADLVYRRAVQEQAGLELEL
jgi:alanine dehydrogenase